MASGPALAAEESKATAARNRFHGRVAIVTGGASGIDQLWLGGVVKLASLWELIRYNLKLGESDLLSLQV
jgi:hypothetical protein